MSQNAVLFMDHVVAQILRRMPHRGFMSVNIPRPVDWESPVEILNKLDEGAKLSGSHVSGTSNTEETQ